MSTEDELAALRAEVAVLRGQVAALSAVPWQQPPGGVAMWPAPCTCGSTAGCQAHLWPKPGNVWVSSPASGAADVIVSHTVPAG